MRCLRPMLVELVLGFPLPALTALLPQPWARWRAGQEPAGGAALAGGGWSPMERRVGSVPWWGRETRIRLMGARGSQLVCYCSHSVVPLHPSLFLFILF